MIEKVVTINLKRREDKWWLALGTYHQQGIPFDGDSAPWGDTIVRFEAHDGQEYADLDAIRKAAIVDGFPHFDNMLPDYVPRGELALCWSWASALRYIIKLDTTVLFLYDDYSLVPHWNWERANQLVRALEGRHPFKLIQISASEFPNTITPSKPRFSSSLGQGVGGSTDCCTILNREGARLLLEASTEYFKDHTTLGPPPDAYRNMWKRCDTDTQYREGIYHTLERIANVTLNWSTDLYD